MANYYENATVVYTTPDGRKIDTFVVFATDTETGLTHINYENLQVPTHTLTLHSKTVGRYHMPLEDSFSFEMLNKLKAKYAELDSQPKTLKFKNEKATPALTLLANAS